MVKAIPMEDWLRGCVYHDGRHGEVTLPTDKVLEIANYIQMTRVSTTDGFIKIPPTIVGKHADQMIIDEIADTPQTDKADRIPYDPLVEMDIKRMVEARLRQTETSTNSEKLQSGVELKQTDCPWK